MKKRNIKITVFLAVFSFFFLAGTSALAVELINPLGNETSNVQTLTEKIIEWLTNVIGPLVAAVMIVFGAYMILTAGGSAEKFKTGLNAILYAVIGYGILFIGSGIIMIIKELLS